MAEGVVVEVGAGVGVGMGVELGCGWDVEEGGLLAGVGDEAAVSGVPEEGCALPTGPRAVNVGAGKLGSKAEVAASGL